MSGCRIMGPSVFDPYQNITVLLFAHKFDLMCDFISSLLALDRQIVFDSINHSSLNVSYLVSFCLVSGSNPHIVEELTYFKHPCFIVV